MAVRLATRNEIKSIILAASQRNPNIRIPKLNGVFEPEDFFDHDTIALLDTTNDILMCVAKEGNFLRFNYWITRVKPTQAEVAATLTFVRDQAITKWGSGIQFGGVFSASCPYLAEHGEDIQTVRNFVQAWISVFGSENSRTFNPPEDLAINEVDESGNPTGAVHGFEKIYFMTPISLKFLRRSAVRPPVVGDSDLLVMADQLISQAPEPITEPLSILSKVKNWFTFS